MISKDFSFSYSMISAYLRCPALFKALYIDKHKFDEPESLTLNFGTALHAGLHGLLTKGDPLPFKDHMDSLRGRDFAKERYTGQQYVDMGAVFLGRFERLHMPHYKLIRGEERMYGTTPRGHRVEGTMDALTEYKGKVTLMDFKTSSRRYEDAKANVSMQLALYTYLAEQAYGVKVQQVGYTVFIKGKEPTIQVQVLEIDQGWLKDMMSNLDDIIDQIFLVKAFPKNYDTAFQYGRECPACFTLPQINVDIKEK